MGDKLSMVGRQLCGSLSAIEGYIIISPMLHKDRTQHRSLYSKTHRAAVTLTCHGQGLKHSRWHPAGGHFEAGGPDGKANINRSLPGA